MNRIGDINIESDVFLEYQELNRLKQFMKNSFDNFINEYCKNPGIIMRSDNRQWSFEDTGSNSVKLKQDSFIFDKINNISGAEAGLKINIPDTGLNYWLYVYHNQTHIESGKVSITTNGTLSGIGTKFTEVLRGNTSIPTKVRLSGSTLNTGDYEVVEVINDKEAILIGSFSDETNLDYAILGAKTPGVVNTYLYNYNDISISLIEEVNPNTKPQADTDQMFSVAKFNNSLGNISITSAIDSTFSLNIGIDDSKVKLSQNYNLLGLDTNNYQKDINAFLNSNFENFSLGVLKTINVATNVNNLTTAGLYKVIGNIGNTNLPLNVTNETVIISIYKIDINNIFQQSFILGANSNTIALAYIRNKYNGSWSDWYELSRNSSENIYGNTYELLNLKGAYKISSSPGSGSSAAGLSNILISHIPNFHLQANTAGQHLIINVDFRGEVKIYGRLFATGAVNLPGGSTKIFTFTDTKYKFSWPFATTSPDYRVLKKAYIVLSSLPNNINSEVTVYLNRAGEFYIENQTGNSLVLNTGDSIYIDMSYWGTKAY